MIEKINTSQIQELVEKLSSKQPNSAGVSPNNAADASLQLDYASFIDKATQSPQTDTNAVKRAQELLTTGQLESTENIRAATENISKFGI
ncbi:MAG: hypothetical protein ACYSWR_05430 [Planctomycetota bacterium]|jgi:hypothetical protein